MNGVTLDFPDGFFVNNATDLEELSYNGETGTVVWRGVNNSGARVTSGVYLVYVRTVSVTEKFKVFKE